MGRGLEHPASLSCALATRRLSIPIVYYDPAHGEDGPFRGGLAAHCDPTDPEGRPPEDRQVTISPNSYHALVGLGVVDRLAEIAPEAFPPLDGAESLLMPGVLEPAIAILYEADRDTYGPERELVVATEGSTEYRLALDRREYQATLSRLIDLFSAAHRTGYAVRLAL